MSAAMSLVALSEGLLGQPARTLRFWGCSSPVSKHPSEALDEAIAACLSSPHEGGLDRSLRSLLGLLDAAAEGDAPATSVERGKAALLHLLSADVPARLVACLGLLDFEAQKDAMRVFGAALPLGAKVGAQDAVVAYMQSHREIPELLLEGCGSPLLFQYCGEMLRSCAQCPELLEALLSQGALRRMLDLAQNDNFDIALEAFLSLRALLLSNPDISATHVWFNFQDFFEQYHPLLQAGEYTTQRQALKLLGEVLLHRSFANVMVKYVDCDRFLKIHMNLLLDNSKAIRLAAFHVFKAFAANPNKTNRVAQVLHRNRTGLVRLLQSLAAQGGEDRELVDDLRAVIYTLQAMRAP